MLARLTDKILVSLDADDAGYVALKRTAELAEKRGLSIKVVRIEGGKDPDEIARRSASEWRKTVDNSVDVYDFVITRSLAKYGSGTPGDIKKILDEVVPFLAKIENMVVREVWGKRLAEKIGVSNSSVTEEVGKAMSGRTRGEIVKKDPVEKVEGKIQKMMKMLILGLLEDVSLRPTVRGWLAGYEYSGSTWKLLLEILESKEKGDVLVDKVSPEYKDEAVEIFMSADDAEKDPAKVKEMGVNLMRELIKEEKVKVGEKLAAAQKNGVEEGVEELFARLAELNRRENRLVSLDLA
jgi:DNA primase